MNAIFCSSCGSKHTFTYAKPKFCSSCGASMGAMLKQTQASRPAPVDDDFDDEDEDSSNYDHVPQIRKLDIEVEKYSESPSFTLGSLFGDNTAQPQTPRRRSSQSLDSFVNTKPRRGE